MKAYQIKIELVGSKPLIWRRVVIPADVTFKRLHDTIQMAMDWYDHHLYEFNFPEEKLRITNDDEAYEDNKFYKKKYKKNSPTKEEDPYGSISRILKYTIRKPQSLKIDDYIEKYKSFEYTYDFGDGWVHKLELENIINDFKLGYPKILEGENACPPEDVGGIPGYLEFLKIIKNPNHEEYESTKKWAKEQNYSDFDINIKNEILKTCLKLKKNEEQSN